MEYADGHKASMASNVISMNLFAQVDAEGNRHKLFDEIADHRTDGKEIKQQDAFITAKKGIRRRRESTAGWKMIIQWKDWRTTWVSLKDTKESPPMQVAEYCVHSRISADPAFAWWVPYVLKKRNRIIAKVKYKYWIRTHEFGIRLPKSVQESKRIDEKNGDMLWWESICKEMANVRVAFEEFECDKIQLSPGYQEVGCHMIFDIKMGKKFRRKPRMVAGGHTTETTSALTYAFVVSRDSFRIALPIAALNELKVLACNIKNVYLTAKCREKIWNIAGTEFGSDVGKLMILVCALYGLKSIGAAFEHCLPRHCTTSDILRAKLILMYGSVQKLNRTDSSTTK